MSGEELYNIWLRTANRNGRQNRIVEAVPWFEMREERRQLWEEFARALTLRKKPA